MIIKNRHEIRGNKAIIFLERRYAKTLRAVIDVDDLEKAQSITGKWLATYTNHTNYVITVEVIDGKKVTTPLHRFLYEHIPEGLVVDHINHDTLDNRRSKNLRVVTVGENARNRMPRSKRKYVC
jgi:hypothetical protein